MNSRIFSRRNVSFLLSATWKILDDILEYFTRNIFSLSGYSCLKSDSSLKKKQTKSINYIKFIWFHISLNKVIYLQVSNQVVDLNRDMFYNTGICWLWPWSFLKMFYSSNRKLGEKARHYFLTTENILLNLKKGQHHYCRYFRFFQNIFWADHIFYSFYAYLHTHSIIYHLQSLASLKAI